VLLDAVNLCDQFEQKQAARACCQKLISPSHECKDMRAFDQGDLERGATKENKPPQGGDSLVLNV
jgi:hypothetical protein